MAHPNDPAVRRILRERGAAQHVVARGAKGLIQAWRHFVGQVETGYPMGIEEYRNDLDIRTLIEVTGVAAEVSSDDQRFRDLLTNTGRAVWSSDVPGAFWVMGYPNNASGQLLEDLRAESLL